MWCRSGVCWYTSVGQMRSDFMTCLCVCVCVGCQQLTVGVSVRKQQWLLCWSSFNYNIRAVVKVILTVTGVF